MGKKLRSPITWFGGKSKMTGKLLALMPKHSIYVEPFGGSAALLFAKPPSPVEIYNDLDGGLINFFRVLRDRDKAARLYMLASQTPYSRQEFKHCRDTWQDCNDDVEKAYRWFVIVRMSFAARLDSWGPGVTESTRGMAKHPSSWLSAHELIGAAHSRFLRVQIEHADFKRVIEMYDTPETLFYLDPPYLHSTRRSGGYNHELSDDDHGTLVQMLMKIEGKALLSGYRNGLYKPLEKSGWRRRDFKTTCHAAGRTRLSGLKGVGSVKKKQERVESVWISPDAK